VELLKIGLVHVQLGNSALDLGVGEYADLLALRDEALHFFKLLQFSY
jgi:hypothetical protein